MKDNLLAAVRELCPVGLAWLAEWLRECQSLQIEPGPDEIVSRVAQAKEMDVPIVHRFYCYRCAGFHSVELTHRQVTEFHCRRCGVWQTVTRQSAPQPMTPKRVVEAIDRQAERAAQLRREAERRCGYELDYALRHTTDSHDATWMSDFSIGIDTDHLLALDSWNEHLMRGMEYGYHV